MGSELDDAISEEMMGVVVGNSISRRGVMGGAGLVAAAAAVAADPVALGHAVIELRQYKIVPGRRDAFVELFEREFVESQEVLGAKLVGQFRDLDDPDRFVWVREFADMEVRKRALEDFYYGPVWKAHREEANPMLFDNDNVLLLRPLAPQWDVPPMDRDGRRSGVVVATIYYLWKDASEGFGALFAQRIAPILQSAGLPVVGAFVPETMPNNFPRLPVRQSEKVLVWLTRVSDREAYAAARRCLQEALHGNAAGRPLRDGLEREPQVLLLAPTPRSRLR